MSGYEIEPVPGLPEPLPAGETLLWQGAPGWRHLAKHSFYLREIGVYFAALLAWYGTSALASGQTLESTLLSTGKLAAAAAGAVALIAFYAFIVSWTTLYTITSRRVVIRSGIALPTVVNVPFKSIEAAWAKSFRDRSGNIALTLLPTQRIAYLVLWPNVRFARINRVEPTLRGIADAPEVAKLISRALAAAASISPRVLADPDGDRVPSASPHRTEPAAV